MIAVSQDTVAAQHCFWCRLLPSEVAVQLVRVFRTSFFQDAMAEAAGHFATEDTLLFEEAEGVGVEHFCPLVALVSCCISARHDVLKLGRHADLQPVALQHCLAPSLFFKGDHILFQRFRERIVGHVE